MADGQNTMGERVLLSGQQCQAVCLRGQSDGEGGQHPTGALEHHSQMLRSNYKDVLLPAAFLKPAVCSGREIYMKSIFHYTGLFNPQLGKNGQTQTLL